MAKRTPPSLGTPTQMKNKIYISTLKKPQKISSAYVFLLRPSIPPSDFEVKIFYRIPIIKALEKFVKRIPFKFEEVRGYQCKLRSSVSFVRLVYNIPVFALFLFRIFLFN